MGVIENLTASSRREEGPLDAYSRTVREVTEKLEPAVISVGLQNGRGSGSGVILGSDGESATAVTNSHVVRGLSRAGAGPAPGSDPTATRDSPAGRWR
jgi:serine protease Do